MTAPAISKVTVVTPNTQRVGIAFTVSGTFVFDGDGPVGGLQYLDDAGAPRPTNATVMTPDVYTYSFIHPGFTVAGTYTVSVGTDSLLIKSQPFLVSAI